MPPSLGHSPKNEGHVGSRPALPSGFSLEEAPQEAVQVQCDRQHALVTGNPGSHPPCRELFLGCHCVGLSEAAGPV